MNIEIDQVSFRDRLRIGLKKKPTQDVVQLPIHHSRALLELLSFRELRSVALSCGLVELGRNKRKRIQLIIKSGEMESINIVMKKK